MSLGYDRFNHAAIRNEFFSFKNGVPLCVCEITWSAACHDVSRQTTDQLHTVTCRLIIVGQVFIPVGHRYR